ncbi:Gfo/Idh/MocA family oxidoreductase [Micromonospora sp. NPDC049679]|uniref:Gfo/Idh/MocA family protein n=1 Tax=Micromonospora sp. NPDC049679 TaxID=3155920 RepID=UPI0033DEA99D
MRVGLFGTGYWAAETQGAALAAHPKVKLVGVWGRDPAKAATLAQRYGTRAYTDVDELIADVDAIAVALPPDVQAGIALRAAEAGRHLLLDKPLALTVEDADRVVAAVERTGVASVVFFTNRFYGNVAEFLDRTAVTGGWHGSRATMFASIFHPGNPYGASPWRREKGGLWDIGPHALSIILPVLGPVTEVAAVDGPRDAVHLVLRHAGGASTTMSLTLDAPPEARSFDFAFWGDTGVAVVPRGDGTQVAAFTAAIDQLLVDLGAGVPANPCDVRFGREVVAVLAAAESARAQRRTVTI